MRAPSSATLLLAVALAVVGLGLGVQALGVAGGSWPSWAPLVLAAYALPFALCALWARRAVRRAGAPGDAPWIARHAGALGLPLLAGGLLLDAALTGRTARTTEHMTWSVVRAGDSAPGEVVLRFRDAPDHLIGIVSPELARHLLEWAPPDVEVELETTSDYGRVRSAHVTRVGELEDFRIVREYRGCSGDCEGSPW